MKKKKKKKWEILRRVRKSWVSSIDVEICKPRVEEKDMMGGGGERECTIGA